MIDQTIVGGTKYGFLIAVRGDNFLSNIECRNYYIYNINIILVIVL